MNFGGFSTPDELEIIEKLGVAPEESEEGLVQTIRLDTERGSLLLSYSLTGRSIRFLWNLGANPLVEIFREGATLIRLISESERTYFLIDFETGGSTARLEIGISPIVFINDNLLLS
ncbi:MAG: hypothetical protein QOF84_2970 [Streptomyces sp.]|nr:hypothetical protein [Streptomyces sp.]